LLRFKRCTLILSPHSISESGQNVTLPCRAPNNIQTVEWSRADLGDDYVFLYRDERKTLVHQHPSFKDRVDLQEKQMKDGDVSLILNNVTINDTGTYECRVKANKKKRRKRANLNTPPICIISLRGPEKDEPVGLIVGLLVSCVLIVAAVVGFVIYRKYKG
uniref:Ig-like domain-containing protein n=1 Tax=Astatotilapia calliptera TaxID=8154 RepID=A0A3P8QLX2_ASTCA